MRVYLTATRLPFCRYITDRSTTIASLITEACFGFIRAYNLLAAPLSSPHRVNATQSNGLRQHGHLRRSQLGLPAFPSVAAPFVALLLSLLTAVVWRAAVRRYRPTGS